MARKRSWRRDADWWKLVRAIYAQERVPARWVSEGGFDKGTLSRKIHGKMKLSAEDAIIISKLAGIAPPQGLLDELHNRAIAAIEFAKKAGASDDEIRGVLARLEKACRDLGKSAAAWEEGDGERDVPPTEPPHPSRL